MIENFQVVNGCQTSIVLYENRKRLKDAAYVIIKLISSTNKDVSDSIVKTTNRQTPVTDEAFETLRDFHKDLESVYDSYDANYKLYYERRSKQYDSTDIIKSKIVSFPAQTVAYVAMFLGEPHSTHRYYGELLKSYKSRMYQEEDKKSQYCIAAMYVFYIDKYLRENDCFTKYRKYKFHIALLCRITFSCTTVPKANSDAMEQLCKKLYAHLQNDSDFSTAIQKSIQIIDEVLLTYEQTKINGNDISCTTKFTTALTNKLGVQVGTGVDRTVPPLQKGNKFKCKVLNWGKAFVNVEILDHREAASIYIGKINGQFINDISEILRVGQIIDAKIIGDEPNVRFGYEMSMMD